MSANVRAATAADCMLLARMHRQCFDQAWDGPAFLRLMERPGTFAMLAGETAIELRSFILIQVAGGEAEILSLGTEPGARRKGLGQMLVAAGAREAFRQGASEIFLEVAEDNRAALALYKRSGFALRGRRAEYYRRPNDAAVAAAILHAALPL